MVTPIPLMWCDPEVQPLPPIRNDVRENYQCNHRKSIPMKEQEKKHTQKLKKRRWKSRYQKHVFARFFLMGLPFVKAAKSTTCPADRKIWKNSEMFSRQNRPKTNLWGYFLALPWPRVPQSLGPRIPGSKGPSVPAPDVNLFCKFCEFQPNVDEKKTEQKR